MTGGTFPFLLWLFPVLAGYTSDLEFERVVFPTVVIDQTLSDKSPLDSGASTKARSISAFRVCLRVEQVQVEPLSYEVFEIVIQRDHLQRSRDGKGG